MPLIIFISSFFNTYVNLPKKKISSNIKLCKLRDEDTSPSKLNPPLFSLPCWIHDTNRGKKTRRRIGRHNKNRVYNKMNNWDSKLQIWLLFEPELIEKKTDAKVNEININKNKFWMLTQNKPIMARQNPILEPKENYIQTTSNLI